jgi:hypothetical protein
MSNVLRREAVFAVSIFVATMMILNFFLDIPIIKTIAQELTIWALIIQLIAVGIGAVNMMRSHYRIISRRDPGRWYFSAYLIALFVIMTLLGIPGLFSGTENTLYSWLFNELYVSLGTTLYAITGFYIFSAGYRAFRARTIDAALMLLSGIIMMLSNAPIGEVIWVGFPEIGGWLLETGQLPWQTSVVMVEAFGMLAFGYRAFTGKERGFYGGGVAEE